ncbi:unnamed protein product [Mytilus coruscus]|uniref:Uncharacterized protein n=1 Tax=Mytilus coruscus TaxID=42192 RepID=A0A6J8E490_MYTCO|nr:unnamed protein product [Mytilus coruscus]
MDDGVMMSGNGCRSMDDGVWMSELGCRSYGVGVGMTEQGYRSYGCRDTLKMKIMRENPDTLQRAVTIAMTEQNLRKKFDLRRGKLTTDKTGYPDRQEPMELTTSDPHVGFEDKVTMGLARIERTPLEHSLMLRRFISGQRPDDRVLDLDDLILTPMKTVDELAELSAVAVYYLVNLIQILGFYSQEEVLLYDATGVSTSEQMICNILFVDGYDIKKNICNIQFWVLKKVLMAVARLQRQTDENSAILKELRAGQSNALNDDAGDIDSLTVETMKTKDDIERMLVQLQDAIRTKTNGIYYFSHYCNQLSNI